MDGPVEPTGESDVALQGQGRIRAHVLVDGVDRVFEFGSVQAPSAAAEGELHTAGVTPTTPGPETLLPWHLVRWAAGECGAGKYFAAYPTYGTTTNVTPGTTVTGTNAGTYRGRATEWAFPAAIPYYGHPATLLDSSASAISATASNSLRTGLAGIGLAAGATTPTAPTPFAMFSMEATTCDAQLDQEEVMLCAAEKLLSLSEASTPVVWNDAWQGLRHYRSVTVGTTTTRRFSVDAAPNLRTPSASVYVDITTPGAAAPPVQFEAPTPTMAYLLRDLAAQVLSYIPVLESRPLLGNGTTCAQGYASLAAAAQNTAPPAKLFTPTTLTLNPASFDTTYPALSGPFSVNDADVWRRSSKTRLELTAGILRATTQMTQTLIERGVDADLGLSGQGSRTLSPLERSQRFWAPRTLNTGDMYNSVAHVMRTLNGRLGLLGYEGLGVPNQPGAALWQGCQSPTWSIEYTNYTLNPVDLEARGIDRPLLTKDDVSADALLRRARLLASSGLTQWVAAPTPPDNKTIRTHLADILVERAADDLQLTGVDRSTFLVGLRADGIRKAALAVDDGALATALARGQAEAYAAVGLGAFHPDSAIRASSWAGVGLSLSERAPGLWVLSGPLGREAAFAEAESDTVAWWLSDAGACAEMSNVGSAFNWNFGTQANASPWYPRYRNAFVRDLYSVAHAVSAETKALQGWVPSAVDATLNGHFNNLAGELTVWSGTMAVTANLPAGSNVLTATFNAIHPDDFLRFGLDPSSLATDVRLVVKSGSFWRRARCAAGIASLPCTNVPGTDGVVAAVPGTSSVTVTLDTAAATDMRSNGAYLVKVPGKTPGSILGAFVSPGQADGNYAFVMSTHRNQMYDKVFALSPAGLYGDPGSTMATSVNACGGALSSTDFVPLENELTNSGDPYESSWKHYLTLAQEAAARSDQLAREMIDLGEARDQRQESQLEKLTEQTGVVGVNDCVSFVNGRPVVDEKKCPAGVKEAMGAERVDIVFLTDDPLKALPTASTDAARIAAMKLALNCATVKTNACAKLDRAATLRNVPLNEPDNQNALKRPGPLGRRNPRGRVTGNAGQTSPPASGGTEEVTYAYLGLAKPTPIKTGDVGLCSQAADAAAKTVDAPLATGTLEEGLAKWLPPGTDNPAKSPLSTLRMYVGDDGEFTVEVGGTRWMSSATSDAAAHLWPACLRQSPNTCSGGDTPTWRAAINGYFHKMFTAQIDFTAPSLVGTPWPQLNSIRYRVMGMLWLSGAMTGRIRDGSFDLPLPAADFGLVSSGWDDGVANATCTTPAATYGNASFDMVAKSFRQFGYMGTLAGDEITALGTVSEMNPNFQIPPEDISAIMPSWYRTIYFGTNEGLCFRNGGSAAHPLTYRHVRAANTDVLFDQSMVANALEGPLGITGWIGNGVSVPGYYGLARLFDDESNPGTSAGSARERLIGAIKSLESGSTGPIYSEREPSGKVHMGRYPRFNLTDASFETPFANGQGTDDAAKAPAKYWFRNSFTTGHDSFHDTAAWYPDTWAEGEYDDTDSWGRYFGSLAERKPSVWPASQRVMMFANGLAPNSAPEAKKQLAGAMLFSCLAAQNNAMPTNMTAAPPIRGVEDIPTLRSWLLTRSIEAREILTHLYLDDVPLQVLTRFRTGNYGGQSVGGRMGAAATDVSSALLTVNEQFRQAIEAADKVGNELEVLQANLSIRDSQIEKVNRQRVINLLQAALSVTRAVGHQFNVGEQIKTVFSVNAVSATESAIALGTLAEQDGIAEEDEKIALAEAGKAVASFNTAVLSIASQQQQNMTAVRQASLQAQRALGDLATSRTQALDAIAKAAGAGAWYCKDASGKDVECKSPVNTVLNRRYSAAKQRYESALVHARALACVARRSIEQRLGVDMAQINSKVGPLDAPKEWANSLATATGFDYAKLRSESLQKNPGDLAWGNADVLNTMRDVFVGDYVEKLRLFVEYYNLLAPMQDGDDVAVISLREHALPGDANCYTTSKNLLRDADHPATGAGWQQHLCPATSANCAERGIGGLGVLNGATMLSTKELGPLLPEGPGDILRLRSIARPTTPEGMAPYATGPAVSTGSGVSQTVALEPGDYVFSFYDVALDPSTGLQRLAGTPPSYRVLVADAGAGAEPVVLSPTVLVPPVTANVNTVGFGVRREVRVRISAQGAYRFGFHPSLSDSAVGAVGILHPQLERDHGGGTATSFERADGDGRVQLASCPATVASLHKAFTRKCEGATCYYELDHSITIAKDGTVINATSDASAANSLAGRVAAGNFNLRQMDVALNLVGTGLIDCGGTPTAGCLSTGTVDFDLSHDARRVLVRNLATPAQELAFNFGQGEIRHGKGLAVERYLSVPLAGADSAAISQPGVLKTELRGRPFDGAYTLRIYETPGFRFERLDDVQLLFHVRYWSPLSK